MDNSELVNDQHGKEIMQKNDKIQRLVEGMSSHSRINQTGDEIIPERDISSDGVVRRINSV